MLFTGVRLRRRNWLFSGKAQLVVALALGVGLPLAWRLFFYDNVFDDRQAFNSGAAITIAIVAGFWLLRRVSTLPGVQIGAGILPSFGISFALTAFAILLLRVDYTRSFLLTGFIITIAFFYLVQAYSRNRRVLQIGLVEGGDVGQLTELPNVECRVLSLSDGTAGLEAVAADFRVDHPEAWEARLADYALSGLPVYHAKVLHESLSGRSNVEQLAENNLGGLNPQTAYMQIKFAADLLSAVITAIVLLPVFVVVAAAIKLDSKGPVMFRQSRLGLGGSSFRVFKFRTMRVINDGAESARDVLITRSNDVRITRVGRFLRRTRIDELPQVINVLRGEMSWIGPRPEAQKLTEWYEQELPFYRYRHIVRPGITGWAQVNQGHVAELDDISTKLQYDFFYIRNVSIWLDIVILIRTVRTILTGFGHK